jgi:hypothetical protein
MCKLNVVDLNEALEEPIGPYRIYLCGPIAGTDDYMQRFEQAEKEVHERIGEYVHAVNPAKVTAVLPGTYSHSEYMTVCSGLVDICDGIYLMKGWENSEGCKEEIAWMLLRENNSKVYLQ